MLIFLHFFFRKSCVCGAILALLLTKLAIAQKILQLTDNAWSERNPAVSQNFVIWAGFDGKDTEIFLYDKKQKKVTTLTQNVYNDINPQVNDKYASWITLTEEGSQIILYDIAQAKAQIIPFGGTKSCDLAMNQRRLAWMDSSQGKTNIYLFDIEKNTLFSVPAPKQGLHHKPQVNNDFVAWQTLNNQVYYINLYKINSGQYEVFSNKPGFNPSLDENYLVWQTYNFNLYLYDIKKKTFLPCLLQGENPKVSDHRIVAHGGKYNSYDVFLYHIPTQKLEQIANTGPSFYDLGFARQSVVWRSFDGNDYEIFLAELSDSIKTVPKLVSQGVYSIYPNPVVDELYIKYKEKSQKPELIQLMELDGALVQRFTKFAAEEDNAVSLKLGGLPPGVYLLEIKKGEILERTKIILQ
jgi:hypothetical protein